jgi:2-phospho-L-lactate/phosphoenolpyruvate guanylyltransferase
MRGHWAVIPVKGLTDSKTRLSNYLGDKKKVFVEALLRDVLTSVGRSSEYDRVIVVSPDPKVAEIARENGAIFLGQTGFGLNRAIEQANKLAQQEKISSLTTILADIPLTGPSDFGELFNLGNGGAKVITAPSLKGGTNVMMTRPPGVVRPSYGRWSYSKHLRQAQIAGIDSYSVSNPRISFDIDTIDDLIELRRRDPEGRTASARIIHNMKLLSQARVA